MTILVSLYLEQMTNHVLYIYGEWQYKFFFFLVHSILLRGNDDSSSFYLEGMINRSFILWGMAIQVLYI